MIDRKALDKKMESSLETVRGGVTSAVDYLEQSAPRKVHALGKRLHEGADRLHLYRPHRSVGLGVGLTLLIGAAVASAAYYFGTKA